MMLALRSTPFMPTMLLDASRALRDGTIPRSAIRGREAELGFQESPRVVFDEWHRRAGADAINGLAVPEHIEVRQKVKMAAAKPIHVLKALADINFRFTNHVREMQAAIAYLDGVAKGDRKYGKVTIEDPKTGEMVTVSSDRAVKEGIHHVQQVYGNLNRMSPVERQIAQSFVPFYGWQKHILGYVMSFPFDHPGGRWCSRSWRTTRRTMSRCRGRSGCSSSCSWARLTPRATSNPSTFDRWTRSETWPTTPASRVSSSPSTRL